MAGEFLRRNRGALTAGAVVGLGVGVAATATAFHLGRRLSKATPGESASLCQELAAVRAEMASLRAEVRELSSSIGGGSVASAAGPSLSPAKERRVNAYVAAASPRKDPELYSASSSSSSDEEEAAYYDAEDDASQDEPARKGLYAQAEAWQRSPEMSKKRQAYELLKSGLGEGADDHEYLWRLSRATFYLAEAQDKESAERKELVFEAKMYAFAAADLEPRDADVQKMCALTLGLSKDYLSISDSILMGFEYKRHIEAALALRPSDPVLHHLSGRWCWAVAELSWLERRAAAALFATPPTSSHSEALKAFLQAEKGAAEPWLVNKLYVAKCYLRLGEVDLAGPFLRSALALEPLGQDDREALAEAEALVKKYGF